VDRSGKKIILLSPLLLAALVLSHHLRNAHLSHANTTIISDIEQSCWSRKN